MFQLERNTRERPWEKDSLVMSENRKMARAAQRKRVKGDWDPVRAETQAGNSSGSQDKEVIFFVFNSINDHWKTMCRAMI